MSLGGAGSDVLGGDMGQGQGGEGVTPFSPDPEQKGVCRGGRPGRETRALVTPSLTLLSPCGLCSACPSQAVSSH